MNDHATNLDRLFDLVGTVCDDDASQNEFVELDSIMLVDREAFRCYMGYCRMHSALKLELRAHQAVQAACQQIGSSLTTAGSTEFGLPVKVETPASFVPTALSTAVHTPLTYFSPGWPVAYLIATVIVGIGALIGTFTYVSHPGAVVQNSSQIVMGPTADRPQAENVGQITGMIDCNWNGAGSHSSRVCLGDQYDLTSGLMEITYRTGAKVILQGPAIYVVNAKNGGSINIGRLTGIMEVADAKGFTLRTPTAVVTDLGTEFGVEVDESGFTTSHVFRGAVSIRRAGDNNAAVGGTVLRENESARTERASDADRGIIVHRIAVNPDVFVRRLEKPTPIDVLAWFRMGEDDPNARAGEPAGKEIHDHNRKYMQLERHGSATYSTDTEAPGSSLSMTFHGGNDGECFSTPRFPFIPNDYFILEAWVKLHKLGPEKQIIVISGQGPQNGYCLTVENRRWNGVFGGVGWIDSGVACEIDKWTHLALVCERGKAQLWINGRPKGKVLGAIPNMPDGPFTIGGQMGCPERAFNGEIDEVRLSTFMTPFRPEMLLLRRADPSK